MTPRLGVSILDLSIEDKVALPPATRDDLEQSEGVSSSVSPNNALRRGHNLRRDLVWGFWSHLIEIFSYSLFLDIVFPDQYPSPKVK